MTDSRQHHHVTLTPRPDAIEATRALLAECAERVAAKKAENGPTSWCAAWDEGRQRFVVDAVFADEAAVRFHQANIGDLVARFGGLMAARPETTIRPLFLAV